MSVSVASAAGEGAREGAPLTLFTWNLSQNPAALDLACEHLANQGPFVAALQEVPASPGSTLAGTVAARKLKLLSRVMPRAGDRIPARIIDPCVALLASEGIDVDPIGKRHEYNPGVDSERRLEGLTLRSRSWQNLQLLGVHAWDRRSRGTSGKRREWARLMRDVVDGFWDGGSPLVVIGDLNANPWSPEITGRHGLYALRRKDWPAKGHGKQAGRDRSATPLYNPMWQSLPDETTGATGGQGTIHYRGAHDLRWHCFDQIIVSDHLREHIGLPRVLTNLGGQSLIDRSGKPARGAHLPVQMKIDLEKVTPCRVFANS